MCFRNLWHRPTATRLEFITGRSSPFGGNSSLTCHSDFYCGVQSESVANWVPFKIDRCVVCMKGKMNSMKAIQMRLCSRCLWRIYTYLAASSHSLPSPTRIAVPCPYCACWPQMKFSSQLQHAHRQTTHHTSQTTSSITSLGCNILPLNQIHTSDMTFIPLYS